MGIFKIQIMSKVEIPIIKIPHPNKQIELYIKREDLVHREISGNKYWKLLYNIENYRKKQVENPLIITFGGAFSNHIAATAALGRELEVPTLGIIRGEELVYKWEENPTLVKANEDGMTFDFVTRESYRDKNHLTEIYQELFPNALIIPEGGSNVLAVEGVQFMLNEKTIEFDYLCTAVGTGGTIAGLSKFAKKHQKVLGFKAVKDDSLDGKILEWSGRNNFQLMETGQGGYGKITDEVVAFINKFYHNYNVLLEPIYTGKMMKRLWELIDEGFFISGSKILAFHTGGLQGIKGANEFLKNQSRPTVVEEDGI